VVEGCNVQALLGCGGNGASLGAASYFYMAPDASWQPECGGLSLLAPTLQPTYSFLTLPVDAAHHWQVLQETLALSPLTRLLSLVFCLHALFAHRSYCVALPLQACNFAPIFLALLLQHVCWDLLTLFVLVSGHAFCTHSLLPSLSAKDFLPAGMHALLAALPTLPACCSASFFLAVLCIYSSYLAAYVSCADFLNLFMRPVLMVRHRLPQIKHSPHNPWQFAQHGNVR
jgi:hypothetical protein